MKEVFFIIKQILHVWTLEYLQKKILVNILTDVKVFRVCESSHAEDNQDLAAFLMLLLLFSYYLLCIK